MTKNLLRKFSSLEITMVQGRLSVFTYCDLVGMLYPDILKQALKLVIKRHPLLNCRIVAADNDFYFQRKTTNKTTFQIIENVKNKHALFCAEFNNPLPETQSLFRITLILDSSVKQISKKTKSTLIIVVHHAIADGACGIELQRKVLQTYADIMHKKTIKTEELPVMSSLDELIKSSIGLGDLNKFVKQYQKQYKNIANAQRLEPASLNITPQINFIQKSLSQKQTKALIDKCKLNKTSVHGAICAASLLTIREQLDKTAKPIMLCCHMPVDMRRRLNPPVGEEHMFCAAGGTIGCYKISQNTSIWNLSKKIINDIRNSILSNRVFKEYLTFDETTATLFPKITAGISSLGNINMPDKYANLKVQQIGGMGIGAFPLITVTSLVFNHKLIINYLYTNPWFAETVVKNIANNINQKLCV